MAIAKSVVECLRAFQSVTTNPDKPDHYLSAQIQDELGRFRVWAGNIAAHRTGRRSLEYRLRDSSTLRQTCLSLLDDLLLSLRELVKLYLVWSSDEQQQAPSETVHTHAAASGDCAASDRDHWGVDEGFEIDDEINENLSPIARTLEEVHEIITCLLRFSMALRNPARHDQTRQLAASEIIKMYQPYDTEHVRMKFPSAAGHIQTRLGKALSKHRHYFKYREQHHQKLQQGLDGEADDRPSTVATSLQKANVAGTLAPMEGIDSDTESLYTATSFAPTVSEKVNLRPPPLPEAGQEGQPFECPICYSVVVAGNEHSWRKHVFEDLPPYICLSEDCPTADQPYARRRDWQRHMTKMHDRQWSCPFGCVDVLSSAKAFEQHLCTTHNQEMEPSALQRLSDACSIRQEPNTAFQSCQLCEKKFHSSSALYKHVGHHLEQLALFALPQHLLSVDSDEEGDGGQPLPMPILPSEEHPRPGDWICPSCGFSNFQHRTACFRCAYPAIEASGGSPHGEAADGMPPEPYGGVGYDDDPYHDRTVSSESGDEATGYEDHFAGIPSNADNIVLPTRSGTMPRRGRTSDVAGDSSSEEGDSSPGRGADVSSSGSGTTEQHQLRYSQQLLSQRNAQQQPQQRYRTQLATQAEAGGRGSEWADNGDDEDDWVPETIEWADGTKSPVEDSRAQLIRQMRNEEPAESILTNPGSRRHSVSSVRSRHSQGSLSSDDSNKVLCPIPTCGRMVKDLKAHMLTHQDVRPEKCNEPAAELGLTPNLVAPMKTSDHEVESERSEQRAEEPLGDVGHEDNRDNYPRNGASFQRSRSQGHAPVASVNIYNDQMQDGPVVEYRRSKSPELPQTRGRSYFGEQAAEDSGEVSSDDHRVDSSQCQSQDDAKYDQLPDWYERQLLEKGNAEKGRGRVIEEYEAKKGRDAEYAKAEEMRIREKVEREKKEAKEREEREYREFLAKQKDKEEEEKAKKKAEKERFETEMRRRLQGFGYTERQIDIIVDEERAKKLKEESKSPAAWRSGSRNPVQPKILRDYLDIKTLEYYRLPYEFEGDYIIIRQDMDKYQVEVLLEHTKRLRTKLLIDPLPKPDKEYA